MWCLKLGALEGLDVDRAQSLGNSKQEELHAEAAGRSIYIAAG